MMIKQSIESVSVSKRGLLAYLMQQVKLLLLIKLIAPRMNYLRQQ